MRHLVLAPIAGPDEAGDEFGRVDLVAGADDDRFDVLHVGTEPLHQRPHGRDERPRHASRVAQPPHDPQAPSHGLDAGADPLEREGLPGREDVDGVGAQVGA